MTSGRSVIAIISRITDERIRPVRAANSALVALELVRG
jgi:hypothetical protein